MSSVELTEREHQLAQFLSDGLCTQDIVKKTGLKLSSVRTYLQRVKAKLKKGASPVLTTPKKSFVVKKSEVESKSKYELNLRRCSSVHDLRQILDSVSSPEGSLEDRARIFKKATCMVCPQPNSCTRCSAKLLMDKFLYE